MDEYGIIARRMKAYELPGAVSELVDWYLFHSDGAPGYCTRRTKIAGGKVFVIDGDTTELEDWLKENS